MSTMYHHLPVEAYTSQEWFDREQRLIFSRSWRFAGLVEDVPGPGHYISVQAGLNNLFIVMGRDHRLRAFHNICRHRGTQLIRAVGKTQKALTCPYLEIGPAAKGESPILMHQQAVLDFMEAQEKRS